MVQRLTALGVDCCTHPFAPPPLPHSSPFKLSKPLDKTTAQAYESGHNVLGVARARRGEGNECLVIVTPMSAEGKAARANAIALAISYAIFRHLMTVPWLAKDVIWVVPDSRYGKTLQRTCIMSVTSRGKASKTGASGGVQLSKPARLCPQWYNSA